MLRVGNIQLSDRPGINALFFLSPSLALIWLMMIGIKIPRLDLFLGGAALILAVNMLINLNSDASRQRT